MTSSLGLLAGQDVCVPISNLCVPRRALYLRAGLEQHCVKLVGRKLKLRIVAIFVIVELETVLHMQRA